MFEVVVVEAYSSKSIFVDGALENRRLWEKGDKFAAIATYILIEY